MSYLPKKPHYIGIATEKSTLKIALLCQKHKKWTAVQLKELSTQDSVKPMDSFPFYATSATAIDGKEVLIRTLELPLVKKKELEAAVIFQASNYLPYPADQAIIESEIIESTENKARINLIAVRKDHLQKHIQKWKSYSIDADVITTIPQALASLSTLLDPAQSAQLFVYVGEQETCCVLIGNHQIIKSYAFPSQNSLTTEIKKVTLSLIQGGRNFHFESIILIGNVSEELKQLIQETTGKPTSFPTSQEFTLSQEKWLNYGLAIGIALSGAKGGNLVKDPFSLSKFLTKNLRSLTFFAGLLICFSLSVGILASLSVSRQKKVAQSQLKSLLNQEGIPLCQPKSQEEFLKLLANTQAIIHHRPDIFALFPMVPNVSEFLSWLSHQEVFKNEAEIQSVHYHLVKHPSISHPKERYTAKISLSIKTKTIESQKLLHDILSQDSSLIDSKQEIEWTPSKEGIQVVNFFLKDKTRYI